MNTPMKCPKCGKQLKLIKVRAGDFYGHTYTLAQVMSDTFKMCDYSKAIATEPNAGELVGRGRNKKMEKTLREKMVADRGLESKTVKDALIKAGFTGVRVRHGTGTAWGWLSCHVDQRGDFSQTDREVITIAQQVTGRGGDYDGNINVHIH